jgi:Cu2+-exporting ATPase
MTDRHAGHQHLAVELDEPHADDRDQEHGGSHGSQHDGGQHGQHGGGHGSHDHTAQFRRRFWIMLVLAIPVVGLSPMFAMLLGYHLPAGGTGPWISPVLGTVMYLWGGWPFLSGAKAELRARTPGMMLLIALAITVAFLSSWGATLGIVDHGLDFWWELALLIVIMLLGHWIEMRSLARTTSALDSLAALLPDEVEKVDGDGIVVTTPAELAVGDLVMVRPGGRVPADGRIVHGAARVDESMITGESRARHRGPGDQVVAGTVATDSGLRIEITAVGENTALAGIRRLVADAQNSSSAAQRIADTAAGWLFWFALAGAAVTAVVWTITGHPDEAVVRAITVLVIACPHALGLAIPLVVSIATERAARGGVLIKDRLALETMRIVDVVVFDKTGTLTRGEPTVSGIHAAPGHRADEVLAAAAAAEADSEHPLARAIVRAAAARGILVPVARDFSSSPAVGISAVVQGRRVDVGGPNLLAREGVDEIDGIDSWQAAGAIVVHVLIDGRVVGALSLTDEVRPESRRAVEALRARGSSVVMITGDADAVARSVAADLGIDRYVAGVRPEDKAARVRDLQGEGHTVAMVGDGVNDAPALAQADVGIAIGGGTDVAIGSAGVILAGDDPRSVLSVIDLSIATYRTMKQNLWWAGGYNLIAVPLAAGVLAPIGFVLPMSVGAVLMSLSTVVVALNAQLLRRLELSPSARELGSDHGAESTSVPIGARRRRGYPKDQARHGLPATSRGRAR